MQALGEAKETEERTKQEASDIRNRIVALQAQTESNPKPEGSVKGNDSGPDDMTTGMKNLLGVLMNLPGFADVLRQAVPQNNGSRTQGEGPKTDPQDEQGNPMKVDNTTDPAQIETSQQGGEDPAEEPPSKQPRVGEGSLGSTGRRLPHSEMGPGLLLALVRSVRAVGNHSAHGPHGRAPG